jgi:hypothetical protein
VPDCDRRSQRVAASGVRLFLRQEVSGTRPSGARDLVTACLAVSPLSSLPSRLFVPHPLFVGFCLPFALSAFPSPVPSDPPPRRRGHPDVLQSTPRCRSGTVFQRARKPRVPSAEPGIWEPIGVKPAESPSGLGTDTLGRFRVGSRILGDPAGCPTQDGRRDRLERKRGGPRRARPPIPRSGAIDHRQRKRTVLWARHR